MRKVKKSDDGAEYIYVWGNVTDDKKLTPIIPMFKCTKCGLIQEIKACPQVAVINGELSPFWQFECEDKKCGQRAEIAWDFFGNRGRRAM